jgi:hypothetical protein
VFHVENSLTEGEEEEEKNNKTEELLGCGDNIKCTVYYCIAIMDILLRVEKGE